MARSTLHREADRPFRHLNTTTGDAKIDGLLAREAASIQYSWFCRYAGDLLVEPRYGYAIDRPMRLLDESMPFSEWLAIRAWRNLIGFPALSAIAAARRGRAPVVQVEQAISLRFYWEDNYFHFLNDILPRLLMADQYGIPKGVPVVVGRKLSARRYFQEAFPDGTIAGRPVIDQQDRFVAAREVVFARPPADAVGVSYVADLLGAPATPVGTRRIFLTRAPARGRSLINVDQLVPVLDEFGFEVVDTDDLTLAQQVELFAAAEFVVGIHGAGLANMIFRRGSPCSVLEIFPPAEALAFFTHLAARLGFAYDALAGYSTERIYDRRQPFMVDPAAFRQKLRSAVDSGPSVAPAGPAR